MRRHERPARNVVKRHSHVAMTAYPLNSGSIATYGLNRVTSSN
jgi:hypothetical protein